MASIKNYGITRIKRVAYSLQPKPFRIDPKVSKNRVTSHQSSLKFQVFLGWKSRSSSFVSKNCQMRQRALRGKEWERTVFLRKNADGILLMGKLESKLFTREIIRRSVNQQAQFEGTWYFLSYQSSNERIVYSGKLPAIR